MKNPLNRRILRELRESLGKYLVIFILLASSIGFVSGFLVADTSMITAYNESFDRYKIEHGNFRTAKFLNKAQKKAVESFGITLYDMFYTDRNMDNGTVLRIYRNRNEIDLVCLMEGRLAEKPGEIALDRLYARNNGISVGDTISSGSRSYTVTGFVALSDYSTLFSDNNDAMFDSVKFGVGTVSAEEFRTFSQNELLPVYAFLYQDGIPAEENEEKEKSEDLLKALAQEVRLKDYIPRFANQAIRFTGEDMGSDRAMMLVLLYIIIVIMAFVFGVTIKNTIFREANVIGTLRASGYTRGELLRHYMTAPMLVSLLGAVAGNLFGYTFFRIVCADMYYNSYSLPAYVTIWNPDAFVLTTVIPLVLMTVITWLILVRALSLSPLKFIRRDLSRRKQKMTLPLPPFLPLMTRFRMRVIFQNAGNYLVLFAGITFANVLLMFGMGLPEVLDNYDRELTGNIISNYQYMLTLPVDMNDEEHKLSSMLSMVKFANAVETENADAEKFNVHALQTTYENYKTEEITLYGIEENSRYLPVDVKDGKIYASSAFAEKYYLSPGDTITLAEKYDPEQYTFTIDGLYDYQAGLHLYMSRETMNRIFDEDADSFAGYFSDTEITDIDAEYIGSVIDFEALTKISRQLRISMGGMMGLVDAFAVIIFLILMFLLSKIIIEKNSNAISLTKILGYTNAEIAGLYVISTSVVVVICLLISMPLVYKVIVELMHYMLLLEMTGWLPLTIGKHVYYEMFALGILSYAVIAVIEYRRISRIPMDEALKNVE